MAVRKGVLTGVRYTTDTATDATEAAAATWTSIPILKILNRENAPWSEETVGESNVNDVEMGAGVKATLSLNIVLDDADTFAAALNTAANDIAPVFFELTYAGNDPIVGGGSTGCIVKMANMPGASFGQFASVKVDAGCSEAGAGDTYFTYTPA